MAQEEVNIEIRTTWAFLAMRLFTWLKSMWLLSRLGNPIIARVYCDGHLSQEIRFNFINNQIDIRIDSCGGEVEGSSDIKL